MSEKMKKLIYILSSMVISIGLIGCKKQSIENIVIGHDLYVHQDYQENRLLVSLIEKTLNNNQEAFSELISFPCGGGAGCYDLGFVVTQIVYKIGQTEFLRLVDSIETDKYPELLGLIGVGLEYGDHDNDNEVDNRKIENEFPEIYERIK